MNHKQTQHSLDYGNWIKNYSKEFLSIDELLKEVTVGEEIKMLFLDDKVEEILKKNLRNVEYQPENFFRECSVLYRSTDADNPLKGEIKWNIASDDWYSFEFHVNIEQDEWEPLKNGICKDVFWKQLPEDNLIGWRGPAIIWDKLAELPYVYL